MALFEKLLGLFGRDTDCNSIQDYKAQSKENITTANVNLSHSAFSHTATGTFDVAVVGVYFHQEILQKICGNKREEGVTIYKQAVLVPENDNPEDANAVRVDIDGETIGHLSRRNATLWRSKMISENLSGVVMRPAVIEWDRGYIAEGSYGVLLDIDLSLPDSKIEPNSSGRVWESPDQPGHIEFLVSELNSFELSYCSVGDPVKLWVARHKKEIFIYRRGHAPGEGKLGICPGGLFKVIAKAPRHEAEIASIYDGGCKISCRLISMSEIEAIEADERKKRKEIQRELTSVIKYSVIDEDIYKCYIANKTGMCDQIGTWDQFKKVEERIAQICQEKNGKYYKTQAKSAKFAIIFDPAERMLSNVTKLQKKGFKVIPFEKAIDHFGLTGLWDCEKLTKAENDYKMNKYKELEPKPWAKQDDVYLEEIYEYFADKDFREDHCIKKPSKKLIKEAAKALHEKGIASSYLSSCIDHIVELVIELNPDLEVEI